MPGIDVTLKAVSQRWDASDERWSVVVEVAFTHTGEGVFDLDKATACPGGRLRNSVFTVTHEGGEVDYQGIMAKRAHPGPDGFHHLKDGAAHVVQVDLGSNYAFPAAGGTFEIAFDHYNHFSKDGVQLTSNTVQVELAR